MTRTSTTTPIIHSGEPGRGRVTEKRRTSCCNTLITRILEGRIVNDRLESVTCNGVPLPYYALPDGSDVMKYDIPETDFPPKSPVSLGEFYAFLRKASSVRKPLWISWDAPELHPDRVVLVFEARNDTLYRVGSPEHVTYNMMGATDNDPNANDLPVHVLRGEEEVPLTHDMMFRIMYQIDAHSSRPSSFDDLRATGVPFDQSYLMFVQAVKRSDPGSTDNIDRVLQIDRSDAEMKTLIHDAAAYANLISDLVLLREHLGLSQSSLAARMGVTRKEVDDFERVGGNASYEAMQRYARAVGKRLSSTIAS